MDADFLTFYRIDLRDPDTWISAESFFARVLRLFHYRGALRDRLQAEQAEQERSGPPPVSRRATPAAPVSSSAAPDRSGTRWVSPNEMKTLFPDMCSEV